MTASVPSRTLPTRPAAPPAAAPVAGTVTAITGHSLAYDDDGNLTTDDQGHTLIYDAWNRLVAVTSTTGTLIAAYTYDGLGRRITSTDGYTLQNLYYSGNQLTETRVAGTTTGIYLWSITYIDALVSRENASGTLYAMYDANFDVTGIEFASTVQERFVYTAGGTFTVDNSSWSGTIDSKNWIIFDKGMEYETSIGWYMDRARIYSPTLQVFAQSEPSGGMYVDGVPLQQAFAANPINRRDPLGKSVISPQDTDTISGAYSSLLGHEELRVQDLPNDFERQDLHGAGAFATYWKFSLLNPPAGCQVHLLQRIEWVDIFWPINAPGEIAWRYGYYTEDWGIYDSKRPPIDTMYSPGFSSNFDNTGKTSVGIYVISGLLMAFKETKDLEDAIKKWPLNQTDIKSPNYQQVVSDVGGGPEKPGGFHGPGLLTAFDDDRLKNFKPLDTERVTISVLWAGTAEPVMGVTFGRG